MLFETTSIFEENVQERNNAWSPIFTSAELTLPSAEIIFCYHNYCTHQRQLLSKITCIS